MGSHDVPSRKCLSWAFSIVASWGLGLKIHDTQCGAKMFRVSDEIRSLFQEPFSDRWIFDVEILARLVRARRAAGHTRTAEVIFELPLERWHDVSGSKVRLRDFFGSVLGLITICRKHWFDNRVPLSSPDPPPSRTDP